MPATKTGRGGQIILTGAAQKAARGAAGETMQENIAAKILLEAAGVVSDGNSVDGRTSTGAPPYDIVVAPFPDEWQ